MRPVPIPARAGKSALPPQARQGAVDTPKAPDIPAAWADLPIRPPRVPPREAQRCTFLHSKWVAVAALPSRAQPPATAAIQSSTTPSPARLRGRYLSVSAPLAETRDLLTTQAACPESPATPHPSSPAFTPPASGAIRVQKAAAAINPPVQ